VSDTDFSSESVMGSPWEAHDCTANGDACGAGDVHARDGEHDENVSPCANDGRNYGDAGGANDAFCASGGHDASGEPGATAPANGDAGSESSDSHSAPDASRVDRPSAARPESTPRLALPQKQSRWRPALPSSKFVISWFSPSNANTVTD
jgi:hypothetical protein